MNPLAVGKCYTLRLPDGRVLGQVRVRGFEDDWAEGPFHPTTAFADVRDLFEKEAQLRKDQIIPLWEEAADRIDSLGIQVVAEDGLVHGGLRIFVEGDEAFLASPLTAI